MPTLDVAISALKAKHGAQQFDNAVRDMQQGANRFDKDVIRTQKGLDTLGAKFSSVAKAAIGFTAIYGIGRLLRSSVREMADFEMQLANVSTMLDEASMSYLPKYETELSKLAVKYGESTTALSKGLYDILSASVDAADALDVLEISTLAAKAGITNTGIAADVLTTIINAYGMSASQASQISDILFATVKRGKTTFDELAQSLGMVVSMSATAGLSLEETTAALATMTRAGIKTDIAVTALRAAISTFLSPADQNIKAAKLLGLELNSNTLRTIGLTGVIQKLNGATAEEIAQIFTNRRALVGLSALLQQTEGFMEDLRYTTDSTGKTMEAFGKIVNTTSMGLTQLDEAWKEVKRTIGKEIRPSIESLIDGMQVLGTVISGTINFIGTDFPDALMRAHYNLELFRKKVLQVAAKIDLTGLLSDEAIAKDIEEIKTILDHLEGVHESQQKLAEGTMKYVELMRAAKKEAEGLGKAVKDSYEYLEPEMTWTDFKKVFDVKPVEEFKEELEKEVKLQKENVKAVERARTKTAELIRELQLEQEIMYLTNDERERAIRLREFEAEAKHLSVEESKKVREQYMKELEVLRDMKEIEPLVQDIREGIGELMRVPLKALLDETQDIGDAIKDTLKNIGRSIVATLYEQMIVKPVQQFAMQFISGIIGGTGGGSALGGEKGLVLQSGKVRAFDAGTVVYKPTMFPMANGGVGIMAEKKPEAIMPLDTDESGRLGIRAIGGQTSQAINIVNVLDPSVFEDYLTSGEGEKAIVNVMRRHQSMIEEAAL